MDHMDHELFLIRIFQFSLTRSRGTIKATRRIRQGDPLSPFIFLLISKLLSALLNRLKMGKNIIHVYCLQFADDTLTICKYKNGILEILRRQLNSLTGAPGRRLITKNLHFMVLTLKKMSCKRHPR